MISKYYELIKKYKCKVYYTPFKKPPFKIKCHTCGKEFIARTSKRKYCCRWHQKTAINRRRVCQYRQPISKFFRKEIEEIYNNRPLGYHVDHIIPINHKLFCGLHVPWNLQYLPAKDNQHKSNKV